MDVNSKGVAIVYSNNMDQAHRFVIVNGRLHAYWLSLCSLWLISY